MTTPTNAALRTPRLGASLDIFDSIPQDRDFILCYCNRAFMVLVVFNYL